MDGARDPIAERIGGPQTGPKGVRADAIWAEELATRRHDREALERRAAITRAGYGVSVPLAEPSSFSLAHELRHSRKRSESGSDGGKAEAAAGGEGGLELGSDEKHGILPAAGGSCPPASAEDGDEDSFLAAFRAARLRELRVAAALPRYGIVLDVEDRMELPESVDAADPRSLVLLLVWERFCPESLPWRDAWEVLAARAPAVRFIRMRAGVASDEFDPIGLPSVVVYRAGKVVEACLRVHEDAGTGVPSSSRGGGARTVEVDTVEAWLVSKDWLGSGR